MEAWIVAGAAHAWLVDEAMACQIAKEVGGMVGLECGEVWGQHSDGGLARSPRLAGWLEDRLSELATLLIFPGPE